MKPACMILRCIREIAHRTRARVQIALASRRAQHTPAIKGRPNEEHKFKTHMRSCCHPPLFVATMLAYFHLPCSLVLLLEAIAPVVVQLLAPLLCLPIEPPLL